VIATYVWWMVNTCTIVERGDMAEIAMLSVVLVVPGRNVVQTLVMKGIKVTGVRYRVETYTNTRAGSWHALCF
jgi:hypothetical protein